MGPERQRRSLVVVGALLASVLAPVTACATTPITEYGPVPSSLPVGGVCEVEFDRSGALWVEQYLSSQVARFDPASGQFTNFSTPMPLSVPGGMDLDPAGDLWMPQVTGNSLLRVDTADGGMTEFRCRGRTPSPPDRWASRCTAASGWPTTSPADRTKPCGSRSAG